MTLATQTLISTLIAARRALLLPVMLLITLRIYLLHVPALLEKGADIWSKWDSGLYLSIADKGYEFFPCWPQFPNTKPGEWCGNAGWMPGYPFLVRLFTKLFGSLYSNGVLISALCTLALFVFAWACLLRAKYSVPSVLVLMLIALFPGSIYYQAVFPISLCMIFAWLSLYFCDRHWPIRAGLCGAVAAYTYSTGMLLVPVLGLWGVVQWLRKKPEVPLRSVVIPPLLTLVGYLLFLLTIYLSIGRWDAFFATQVKYGHGLNNPFEIYYIRVLPLFQEGLSQHIQGAETLFVALLVLGCCVLLLVKRAVTTSLDWLTLLYSTVFWIFPLTMGTGLSIYRSEALLLPLAYLCRHFPTYVMVPIVVCAGFIAMHMAELFFLHVLV